MKKWQKFLMLSFITVIGIIGFYNASRTHSPVKSYSLAKKALVLTSPQSTTVARLMNQVAPKRHVKTDAVKKLKLVYYNLYNKEGEELSNNLNNIEKVHSELINLMRTNGVTIDAVTMLKPRLALAISYNLNLHVTELSASDLSNLELSNKEWYLIKTFSESSDFKLMIKRNTLTTSFVQPENLANLYNR